MSEIIERPEFLTPSETKKTVGMEMMEGYYQPSFLKVIQETSKEPFKPPFADGDVIAVPNMVKIASLGESFHFIPLFFYPEFTIHNPIQVEGLDFIRERTIDPESEIAKRARSRNEEDRTFDCPENSKFDCSYVEHLNFIVLLDDHKESLGDTPIVISLFKGEWRRGINFISLLDARKAEHICGCRFQTQSAIHTRGRWKWYGLDFFNPEEKSPWVEDVKTYEAYQRMHTQLKKNYEEANLMVDYGAGAEKTDEGEGKF